MARPPHVCSSQQLCESRTGTCQRCGAARLPNVKCGHASVQFAAGHFSNRNAGGSTITTLVCHAAQRVSDAERSGPMADIQNANITLGVRTTAGGPDGATTARVQQPMPVRDSHGDLPEVWGSAVGKREMRARECAIRGSTHFQPQGRWFDNYDTDAPRRATGVRRRAEGSDARHSKCKQCAWRKSGWLWPEWRDHRSRAAANDCARLARGLARGLAQRGWQT